jgi:putative spermidine/putrescine transport system ATP-binding protein
MLEADHQPAPHESSATGVVTDVVYLGAHTRYTVELDAGGKLVVLQQNLSSSSMEAVHMEGRRVRLVWDPQFNRPVEAAGEAIGSQDPKEEGA